jgi:hypothetical protein
MNTRGKPAYDIVIQFYPVFATLNDTGECRLSSGRKRSVSDTDKRRVSDRSKNSVSER